MRLEWVIKIHKSYQSSGFLWPSQNNSYNYKTYMSKVEKLPSPKVMNSMSKWTFPGKAAIEYGQASFTSSLQLDLHPYSKQISCKSWS